MICRATLIEPNYDTKIIPVSEKQVGYRVLSSVQTTVCAGGIPFDIWAWIDITAILLHLSYDHLILFRDCKLFYTTYTCLSWNKMDNGKVKEVKCKTRFRFIRKKKIVLKEQLKYFPHALKINYFCICIVSV